MPDKILLPEKSKEEIELVVRELMDKNDKVVREIFEDNPIKDGLPCVPAWKIKSILKANGFKSAINPQSL